MSGGSKQQFKQFTINSIQDACLALGMLISGVIVNLEKYKESVTMMHLQRWIFGHGTRKQEGCSKESP